MIRLNVGCCWSEEKKEDPMMPVRQVKMQAEETERKKWQNQRKIKGIFWAEREVEMDVKLRRLAWYQGENLKFKKHV